jgi:hypothetical protein
MRLSSFSLLPGFLTLLVLRYYRIKNSSLYLHFYATVSYSFAVFCFCQWVSRCKFGTFFLKQFEAQTQSNTINFIFGWEVL